MLRTFLALSIMSVACACVFMGCDAATTVGVDNGPPQTQPTNPVTKYLDDIKFFTKTGVTLALNKSKVPVAKVTEIRAYVEAVRRLIVVPNKPDFSGARELAKSQLPEGNRAVGLAIVDILERYVPKAIPPVQGEAVSYQEALAAALDSVVQALDQYTGQ